MPSAPPVRTFRHVFHVGDFDRAQKRAHSHEGSGLSVCRHPDAWREIAGAGGETWRIDGAPIRLLDIHRLDDTDRARIADFAVRAGYARWQNVHEVRYYDSELDDTMTLRFLDPGEAQAEALEVDGACRRIRALVATDRLCAREGMAVDLVLVEDLICVRYSEEVLWLDGAWWQERLDPLALSAPRGVIHNTRLGQFRRRIEGAPVASVVPADAPPALTPERLLAEPWRAPLDAVVRALHYHGTTAAFTPGGLRGGGDGLFWITDNPLIASTYIPENGGLGVALELDLSERFPRKVQVESEHEVAIAASLGYALQVLRRGPGARVESWQWFRDGESVPAPSHADLARHLEETLGYTGEAIGDRRRYRLALEALPDGGVRVRGAGSRPCARLILLAGVERLSVRDLGTSLEGDLSDPDHLRAGDFAAAAAGGCQAVAINDFCQSPRWGNFGHRAIGLTPRGLQAIASRAIPAAHADIPESGCTDALPKSLVDWHRNAVIDAALTGESVPQAVLAEALGGSDLAQGLPGTQALDGLLCLERHVDPAFDAPGLHFAPASAGPSGAHGRLGRDGRITLYCTPEAFAREAAAGRPIACLLHAEGPDGEPLAARAATERLLALSGRSRREAPPEAASAAGA